MTVVEDPTITARYPEHFGARVNGLELVDTRGDPERPISEADIIDKMHTLAAWGGLLASQAERACALALEGEDCATAVELGGHGITVNAVCPNHVTTGLGAQQNEYFSRLLGFENVEAYLRSMAAKNPMGRPGLPIDTAAACAWLASDGAFYVTGEALNVSGGEEMH